MKLTKTCAEVLKQKQEKHKHKPVVVKARN